ncbi:decarboxylase [Klebsiella pneumoniae]|uniref:Decarboxylase n=1 Tax=Klebsiella pneumoniae TaxID=573 RepID=A0A2X3CEE9_KLEPN|nr:decarboxylase [Klebsiella pneumoniae]
MKKADAAGEREPSRDDDAYSFNWSIRISPDLQMPFDPTHENMANLKLSRINRWKCWPPTCVAPSPDWSRERQRGGHPGH